MHYTVVIVSCGQSQSQSNHKLCDRLTAKNAPSCIVKHKNPNQVRIKRGTQFYIVSAKVSFSLHHLAHLNDVVASRRHFTIKWLTIKWEYIFLYGFIGEFLVLDVWSDVFFSSYCFYESKLFKYDAKPIHALTSRSEHSTRPNSLMISFIFNLKFVKVNAYLHKKTFNRYSN